MVAAFLFACAIAPWHPIQCMKDRAALAGPTNGYAEYLQAAILLEDPKVSKFLDWRRFSGWERPSWVSSDATPDELMELERKAIEPAREWVRRGNEKSAKAPESMPTVLTLYPETHRWRQFVHASTRVAEWEAKRGESDPAFDRCFELLKFAKPIQDVPLLSALVTNACRIIAVDGVTKALPFLAEAQLNSLEVELQTGLTGPSSLISACDKEIATFRESYRQVAQGEAEHWEVILERGGILDPQKVRRMGFNGIKKIPASRKQDLYERFMMGSELQVLALKSALLKPEPEWLRPLEFGGLPCPIRQEDFSEHEFLLCFGMFQLMSFFEYGDESVAGFLRSEVRFRLRHRMALKAIEVARFRLKHERLPKDSTEVWGPRPNDPITRYPYQFRAHPDGVRFQVRSWFDGKFVNLGTPPEAR